MPKRLIKEAILVVRNGQRIKPEIGKMFDLTDAEIKDLEAARPQAIAKAKEVEEDSRGNQSADDNDGNGDAEDDTAAKTPAKTAAKGKGKAAAKTDDAGEDL